MMSIDVLSDQEVLQEVNRILLQHMSPDKLARFWAIWQAGDGNYLTIREGLFADETVETLYPKIAEHERKSKPAASE
jgi:hypothetical protein